MQTALPAMHASDYLDLILVECPRCRGRAEAKAVGKNRFGVRRVVCTRCSGVKTVVPRGLGIARLPTQSLLPGYSLWLEARTRLGTLYAFNHDHLDHIATYVAASLRKVDFSQDCFRNSAVTSRLPAWVKSAKNRAEILKTIEKMRRI